ncbi:MAG: TonB-dependent receptor [Lysobacterales bacterium]|nr:MAG: TonB-dependent receptor [Xanthomonadales bacterium]
MTQAPLAENVDNLSSYRVGFVFKPTEASSVYLATGNSETPSQSSVNGACTLISTTPGAENCNVDPEEAETVELGGKWDVNGRLSLNAAVFRNERTNFRVNSGDPVVTEQQLDGSSRVDGVALGAAGQIGEKWSVFANYTYLDSEVLQNISDIAIGGGAIDILAGDPLPNTPEHSASVWTTYRVSDAFDVGYGVTYQGEYTFSRAGATADLYYTPSYVVHRAMASYTFSDSLALQLNINNVTDEIYFDRVRNNAGNGWATPGATRTAVLRLNWRL